MLATAVAFAAFNRSTGSIDRLTSTSVEERTHPVGPDRPAGVRGGGSMGVAREGEEICGTLQPVCAANQSIQWID